MMTYIMPYKRGSKSARILSEALGIPFFNLKTTQLYPGDTIINWGSVKKFPDSALEIPNVQLINHPLRVETTMDKRTALDIIHNSNRDTCLPYSTDINVAIKWIQEGATVFCRTLVKSREGRGIVVATNLNELVEAPLYTKGVSCKREYRVHVAGGEVIDLTAKVKITNENHPSYQENPDANVRNLKGGYVFARNAVKIPEGVHRNLSYIGREAISYFHLHFGAVDIIRTQDNKYYILEVNTAPGITNTTVDAYIRSFMNMI